MRLVSKFHLGKNICVLYKQHIYSKIEKVTKNHIPFIFHNIDNN